MSLLNKMLLDLEARQRVGQDGAERGLSDIRAATTPRHVVPLGVAVIAVLVSAVAAYALFRVMSAPVGVVAPAPYHVATPVPVSPVPHSLPAVPAPVANPPVPVPLMVAASTDQPQPRPVRARTQAAPPRPIRFPISQRMGAARTRDDLSEDGSGSRVAKVAVPLSPAERARRAYVEASAALERGQTRQAISDLRSSVALDPKDNEARELLAGLELQRGHDASAETLLKEGLVQSPSYPRFAELLANLYVKSRRMQLASAVLTAHRAAAASNPKYLALLAAVEARQGQFGAAAADYRAALVLAPSVGAYWAGLAIVVQTKDPRAARRDYRHALSDPALPAALAHYARNQLTVLGSD